VADPLKFERGVLKFEAVQLDPVEQTSEVKVFDLDCDPPPVGTQSDYNPKLQVPPVFQPRFLQQSELAQLLEGARQPGETSLSSATLLAALADAWKFKTFDIDLSKIPDDWEAPVPCFITSIRFYTVGNTFEVTARAARDVTLGGEAFPAGDTVATFRIWRPLYYQFIRRFTWNPKCCPGVPEQIRGEERTDAFYPGKPDFKFEDVPPGWFKGKNKFKLELRLEYTRPRPRDRDD
jgi:hypothetical protein